MLNNLKIGVIGAGRWGQNIIRTLFELNALAAVAESNPDLSNKIAREFPGILIYSNHQQLLQNNDIQAVAIATPVLTHYQIAREALLADKDVFVEKPMTVTSIDGKKLVNIAKESKKILMVGHMLLYQPAIQFIKAFLMSGQLGQLYSLRQVRRNLGTIRTQENVLYSLGVHDLAVLNYIVGEPAVKISHVEQVITTKNIADDMTLHLAYESGVQAHLHVSWLWPEKDRQLMILGEKGALHYDESSQQVTWHKAHGNSDATCTNNGSELIFKGDGQPLRLEMEHFIDCIEKRKPPMSPGEQGVSVVEIIEQITQKQEQKTATVV